MKTQGKSIRLVSDPEAKEKLLNNLDKTVM